MRFKKIILGSVLLLGFGLIDIHAQQTIPAIGGKASGSGGAVSYTVGQIVYTTNTGSNGSVAQGVQQPYEISIVTGIKEANEITLQCNVYPNPANDFIVLKVENFKIDKLSYQFYDIEGKLLDDKVIGGSETNILMYNMASGIYFLKVIYNNEVEVKTFKIIKN